MTAPARLGANLKDHGCALRVWAPHARRVEVEVRGQRVPMIAGERGYFSCTIDDASEGERYRMVLDGERMRPDPASRSQPEGVHGPSAIVDHRFRWSDAGWRPPPLATWVLYELHVGTFTREGTFEAAIAQLGRLAALGISAIEIMPVASFPGDRNWGYDGVCPFAVHEGYGGAHGLAAFVDACHRAGIAVVLDVVYNHLGPEGNVLGDFGPYFTDRYRTPWGPAINFDGADSDEVREYFIENALMWLRDFHVDALRLDAVHAIVDPSARPFLADLSERVEAFAVGDGRPRSVIAESDANDPRLLRPRTTGGLGMDAVWADDFHHAVHVLVTSERSGYYDDFSDRHLLLDAISEGFAYRGQYSAYRRRRHGAPADDASPSAFVVCVQNHDQVGNRLDGARLGALTSVDGQRLAAALLLTSPHVPLLFMGQEYGETHPFAYFTSHGDRALVEAVRRGRREELSALGWSLEPLDPQAPSTFQSSKLDPDIAADTPHRELLALHRRLLEVRREHAAWMVGHRPRCELLHGRSLLRVQMGPSPELVLLANLDESERHLPLPLPFGGWRRLVDAGDPELGGGGSVLGATMEGEPMLALPGWWFGLLERAP